MSRRVPEYVQSVVCLQGDDGEISRCAERAGQVPELPVELDRDGGAGQTRPYRQGDIQPCRIIGMLMDRSVWVTKL
jgi:hypothetical protein